MKGQSDFVVGLTHVAIAEDREISRQVPGLKLIMGGHEHDHMHHTVGEAVIAKADANAKTVYVHRLTYDHKTRQLDIQSKLVVVDTTVPFHPETQAVVHKWTEIAAQSFRTMGFDPDEVVMTATQPLDGREAFIRHQPTNLTQLVVEAFTKAAPRSELALLNSGSLRVDDQLNGNITQYDILRTLPFGGKLLEADIKGELLEKILDAGRASKGEGGYLQHSRVAFDEARKSWLVGGKLLQTNKIYRVALPAFLLTGGEKNLEFLKPENPGVVKVYEPAADDKSDLRTDIRLAVISYMRSLNK
jgi:5'-nucleotidase